MMALTFAIGFAVAWVIAFVVRLSDAAELRENKGEELKRLRHMKRTRRKNIKQMMRNHESASGIELVDYYYSDKKEPRQEIGWNEAVKLFFPEKKDEKKSDKSVTKFLKDRYGKL